MYVHVDNGKLEAKSRKYIFLSYQFGVNGYKVWYLETNKLVISRDVVFDENAIVQKLPLKYFNNTTQKKKRTQVKFGISSGSKPESLAHSSSEVKKGSF